MTRFKSIKDWLEQSKLLLEARPTTSKVTMKYSLKAAKTRKAPSNPDTTTPDSPMPDAATAPKPLRGALVIKTYDPVGGVVLKYYTNKATEVMRLMHALEQIGQTMAAVPEEGTTEPMPDAPTATETDTGAEAASPYPGEAAAGSAAAQAQMAPQGGGKKRRKGKR